MYRTVTRMPVPFLIVLAVWLLVVSGALVLCAAARRTDAELAGRADLAPVIDLEAAALASRRHSAA